MEAVIPKSDNNLQWINTRYDIEEYNKVLVKNDEMKFLWK